MTLMYQFRDDVRNQFNQYVDCVYETNQKFNLTGFKTKAKIYEHLVLDVVDCLSNLKLDFNALKILDVGSGSGSPGIIISILYPKAKIVMVDANAKKCLFIKDIIKLLRLNNASVICSRIEKLDLKFNTFFDLGISRAVDSINVMNELIVKWIKINGIIVHLKSKNYLRELEIAKNNTKTLGIVFKKHLSFTNRAIIFNNFIFQKIVPTSKIFPRDWKQIKKDNAA